MLHLADDGVSKVNVNGLSPLLSDCTLSFPSTREQTRCLL